MADNTTASVTAPTIRRLDHDGDLQLDVGRGAVKQSFLVCSRSLSRASRPLKAMLQGGFAESRPDNNADWVVSLPEDNPRALSIILSIIHNDFKSVPKKMGRDDLFQVTILVDKYDITELLRPWAQQWVGSAP